MNEFPARRPALSEIAVGVNPRFNDGSDVKIKSNQVNGVKFCAYITPAPDTVRKRHECGAAYKKVTFARISEGYTVRWRYVIRGRGWVMVRDPNPVEGEAPNIGTATVTWWFVRRSAFDKLCRRASVTPSIQACEPTN